MDFFFDMPGPMLTWLSILTFKKKILYRQSLCIQRWGLGPKSEQVTQQIKKALESGITVNFKGVFVGGPKGPIKKA